MLQLTPRIYKRNMKWSLLPKNKIDTVMLSPISNTVDDEATPVHTETFTLATIGNEEVTLPVSNDKVPTHWHNMLNTRWVPFTTFTFAKASVECIMASGSRVITLDQATAGTLSAKITLNGTSSVVNRGGSTFNSYPSIDNLASSLSGLSSWIEANKTATREYLSGIYENNVVWMNPWIRKVVPPSENIFENTTTANDIITNWINMPMTRAGAVRNYWAESSSFGQNADVITMSPTNVSGSVEDIYASQIVMRNLKLSMSCTVTKVDDYRFFISWVAPVRLSYMAASRERGPLGGEYDVDNLAFVDNITSVAITLYGQPRNTTKVDMEYSLDDNGALTQDASGIHAIKVDAEEAFTTQSYYAESTGNVSWSTYLSNALLSSYKNGKYIVECDVPAHWALQNNVGINTKVQICLQDGTFIKRENTICTFSIKNIEKIFKNSEFTYSLKLMEV